MCADANTSHPRLTPNRIARITMRWRQGWPLDRMLRAHKDLPRDILRAICAETRHRTDELAPPPKNLTRKWKPEEIATLRQMLADGVAHAEIAERLKRTIPAVKAKADELRTEADYAKQATTQAHTTARPRKCLRCERIFPSEGPHNRLCGECRHHEVYRGMASCITGVGRR